LVLALADVGRFSALGSRPSAQTMMTLLAKRMLLAPAELTSGVESVTVCRSDLYVC
jgi:hypothetical protein